MNNLGQLGNNSSIAQYNYPVRVTQTGVLANRQVTGICAGAFHSLAVCADGGVVAWGDNVSGELGDGGTETKSTVPVNVYPAGVLQTKTVTAVSAGAYHSVALCSDGSVARCV